MTQQQHSAGASPEMDEHHNDELRPAPLISASTILAEAGAFGLLWLDMDLEITARYGALVSDIEIGAQIVKAIPALFGYEDDIRPLAGKPGKLFVLPAVSMLSGEFDGRQEHPPRLNITAFWSKTDSRYILLVARASSASQTDIEISHQMRKRLMAEEALAQKTKELQIANRDLEEYAEIISHDLSTPLRAIRYLTDDIQQALETCDRTSAEKSLIDLRAQSKRMSSMMIALLDYASLGRKSEILEPVDTAQMVAEIIRALPHPKGLAIGITGHWPLVKTMRAPLDLVIRNLVDNAIKHHDKTTGSIRVNHIEQSGSTNLRFSVQDDGPGIDPGHHAAVWLPFRTLKTSHEANAIDQPDAAGDQHPSSRGMGLALVKRTVESVGGTLTLQSNPAQRRGTQFLIDWPIAPTAP